LSEDQKISSEVIELLKYDADIKPKDSEGKTVCEHMIEDKEFIKTSLFQTVCRKNKFFNNEIEIYYFYSVNL